MTGNQTPARQRVSSSSPGLRPGSKIHQGDPSAVMPVRTPCGDFIGRPEALVPDLGSIASQHRCIRCWRARRSLATTLANIRHLAGQYPDNPLSSLVLAEIGD